VWEEARERNAAVIKNSASAKMPSLSYEEEYLRSLTVSSILCTLEGWTSRHFVLKNFPSIDFYQRLVSIYNVYKLQPFQGSINTAGP
jgi:hypothetical protein